MWPMMFFGGIFWVVLLVVLAVVAMRLLRGSERVGDGHKRRSPGLETVEHRYAKGEIQREEYLQQKRDLGAW